MLGSLKAFTRNLKDCISFYRSFAFLQQQHCSVHFFTNGVVIFSHPGKAKNCFYIYGKTFKDALAAAKASVK
jgi:hypothetical protein